MASLLSFFFPSPFSFHGFDFLIVCMFQSKNALLSTFLFLDQVVWLGRSGIYKVKTVLYVHFRFVSFFLPFPKRSTTMVLLQQNKERAELLGRISLFCWMGSSVCSTLVEVCCFQFSINHWLLYFGILNLEQFLVMMVLSNPIYPFHVSAWRAWEAFYINEKVREGA